LPSDWKEHYGMLRPDMPREELRKLIEEIKGAIFVRTQELQNVADSNGEFNAMVEAMRTIRRLQIEKLQYPNFYPESKYKF
jgi:hypothetical protein